MAACAALETTVMSTSGDQLNAAYEAGYDCGIEGDCNCPYQQGSDLEHNWCAGYYYARRVANDKWAN